MADEVNNPQITQIQRRRSHKKAQEAQSKLAHFLFALFVPFRGSDFFLCNLRNLKI